MCVKEGLPGLVPAGRHARQFSALECIHGYAADEGDVHAETAMDARAIQAHEDAEFGRGLACGHVSLASRGVRYTVSCAEDRTHCGLGAPQSTQLLFSFSFCMSSSYSASVSRVSNAIVVLLAFVFVSGSTSHIVAELATTTVYVAL